MTSTSKLWFAILIPALGVFAAGGCGKGDEGTGKKKPPPLVYADSARTMTISKRLELNGEVEPVRIATIASPAEGPVQDLAVREGDAVHSGDIIMSIGRSEAAEASLEAARQQFHKENEELSRVRQLVEAGALPGEALDQQEARFKQAQAELAKAQETIRDYVVRVPWDGVVSRVFVRDGNYVAPRAPLAELFDPASLIIRFAVPEEHALDIENGTVLVARFDAYPGKRFKAEITRVYPGLERDTRTRTVEAELIEEALLLNGMFVRVSLPIATAEDAVVVPASAILATPSGQQVAFVIKNGVASRREVKTGIEEGTDVQIVDGISGGELVVIRGNENLKDGARVRMPLKPKPGKARQGVEG